MGEAVSLHRAWPTVADDPAHRTVSACRVTDVSVVLGSTQPESVVDGRRAEAAGVSVVRRSSGGGAVLVSPGEPVWVDVWIPVTDPLWDRAVDRAFDWLGRTWVQALASLGLSGLTAHREGYVACTRWSSLVCFGGVGAGEVVTGDGRKVVGLAQRRNRHGAWFHGACVRHWDPAPLVGLLDLAPDEREAATAGLGAAVVGVGDLGEERGLAVPTEATLVSAFLASLP